MKSAIPNLFCIFISYAILILYYLKERLMRVLLSVSSSRKAAHLIGHKQLFSLKKRSSIWVNHLTQTRTSSSLQKRASTSSPSTDTRVVRMGPSLKFHSVSTARLFSMPGPTRWVIILVSASIKIEI